MKNQAMKPTPVDLMRAPAWDLISAILLYSTGFKKIEKINATAPQPQRNVLKYFAIFKNVAHSFEPGETLSYSVQRS